MYLSFAGVYFNSTSHNVREFVARRTEVEVIVVQYKATNNKNNNKNTIEHS